MRNATEEHLKGLFEICLNMIRGNLTIKPVDFQRFKRHKDTLTALASKKVLMYTKQRILNQKADFQQSGNVCSPTPGSTYSKWYSKKVEKMMTQKALQVRSNIESAGKKPVGRSITRTFTFILQSKLI